MHHSYSKFDKKNDESMKKILVGGFSGTVDIIWGEDVLMMLAKSRDGKQSKGTFHKSKKTVIPWIGIVEEDKGKQYCIGRMTQEKYSLL